MNKVRMAPNGRQSLWQNGNNFYVCSTALYLEEVMVFAADAEGYVTDYMDLYVDFTDVNNHDFHMALFAKELSNGS